MVAGDTGAVADLIGGAMNHDEAVQAEATLASHFRCRRHGIDDGRRYHVLDDGGAVCGVVGLHHYLWGPPENVWLAWFAVDPVIQASGHGTRLLEFAIQEAQANGYMKLFVETYSTPEFAQACAFYRAKGFAMAGGVRAYLPNGGDMLVFMKELTHAI